MWQIFRKLGTDYGAILGGAVLAALLTRVLWFQTYQVPTLVMSPLLIPGDYVWAQKTLFPTRDTFQVGDIVVYLTHEGGKAAFIKRIVGRPGDVVGVEEGHLLVNGQMLTFEKDNDEEECGREIHPYRSYPICLREPAILDAPSKEVKKGHLFLMADQRTRHISDRAYDEIPIRLIQGKVTRVWFSSGPESKIRFDRLWMKVD